jgi:3-dehydroquinate synthase
LREIFLPLPAREQSCRICLMLGLRLNLGPLLAPFKFPPRLVVVSDRRVARLYGAPVLKALAQAGYDAALLSVAPGERSKRWPVVERLARELLARGAHRGSALLALGGGVVGDLTGFLASIFMRGLDCIQVPTTILAMVDAAIGGKTAINLKEGKNLLGTFHQPRLVAIDPQFLSTLPGAERRNGLAEVVKAGFIRDPDLLDRLAAGGARLFSDEQALSDIIYRAAAIKAEVVAADEREGDLRRILNFGHTLGHGLEQASAYKIPHGRAVAWGMVAALRLSEELAGLPPPAAARGRALIRDLGLLKPLPPLNPQAVLEALALDKKRREAGPVFVLLRRLGEPVIAEQVPGPRLAAALAEVLEAGAREGGA